MVMHVKNDITSAFASKDKQLFNVTATMPKLGDEFFDNDPPILETDKRTICVYAHPSRMLQARSRLKFGMQPAMNCSVWLLQAFANSGKKGHDSEDKQEEILDKLNKLLNNTMIFSYEAEVSKYGFKETRFESLISLNSFEIVTE